jgi:hypothetical protein
VPFNKSTAPLMYDIVNPHLSTFFPGRNLEIDILTIDEVSEKVVNLLVKKLSVSVDLEDHSATIKLQQVLDIYRTFFPDVIMSNGSFKCATNEIAEAVKKKLTN